MFFYRRKDIHLSKLLSTKRPNEMDVQSVLTGKQIWQVRNSVYKKKMEEKVKIDIDFIL